LLEQEKNNKNEDKMTGEAIANIGGFVFNSSLLIYLINSVIKMNRELKTKTDECKVKEIVNNEIKVMCMDVKFIKSCIVDICNDKKMHAPSYLETNER
jgi:hypothetical protein